MSARPVATSDCSRPRSRARSTPRTGTRNHCETVSELCVLIGEALGLEAERLERIRLAGLLHDVGKIGVADRILRKPGLDADEAAMSGHVHIGHAIVAAADLEEEARWVSITTSTSRERLSRASAATDPARVAHHPRRRRVRGDDRQPAVQPQARSEALAELELRAGTQFDPEWSKALLGWSSTEIFQKPSSRSRLTPKG